MQNLLYYSFLYAGLLALLGYIMRRRLDNRVYLWAGLLLGAVVMLGVTLFFMGNLGKKPGLEAFNFFGMDLVLYVSGAVSLVSVIIWFVKKKFWPVGIITILSVLQVVFYFLLKIYFSKA